MRFILLIFISIIVFTSCILHKNVIDENNRSSSPIEFAIYNFVNTSSLFKDDSVFSVRSVNINKDVLGVSIIGRENKFFPTPNIKLGSHYPSFPTQFLEVNNKLFVWYDSTQNISSDLIMILSRYNQLDSMNVESIVQIPEYRINDAKKAMYYFFCKKNLSVYKKVKTSIALDWYDPPVLNCK